MGMARTGCKSLVFVILLVIVLFVGYIRYQFLFKHSRDFNSVSDRPSVAQLIVEGLDIVHRHKFVNENWAKSYHKAHNLTGKTILLTGATKGLGRGIANHLASFGATLVIPCRRCDVKFQTQQLLNDVRANSYRHRESHETEVTPPIFFNNVDLSNLDEIDAMIAEYQAQKLPPLSAVILNAGLVSTGTDQTPQGFETTFGVNFVSAAYLTQKLLDHNLLLPTGRIVSVSSEDHRVSLSLKEVEQGYGVKFGQFWASGVLDSMTRYDFSKLSMTTYFLALSSRITNPVLDICPGPVDSEITTNTVPGPLGVLVKKAISFFMVPIEDASIPVVRLAVDDAFANVTGKHFHITEERLARGDARDAEIQSWVYDVTQQMISQKRPPPVHQ